jgi:hypothetical protein
MWLEKVLGSRAQVRLTIEDGGGAESAEGELTTSGSGPLA